MKLIIISGLSGSGKSTALNALEDLQYYCIDNLPAGMLPVFAEQMMDPAKNFPSQAAVGVDARNLVDDIKLFPHTLKTLRDANIECQVIYLNAEDSILIKRFSETRRKHPLTSGKMNLAEAIANERELLEPIANSADLFLDTSHVNVHQLRQIIVNRIAGYNREEPSIQIQSFGFKHGLPSDADFVFDVRCLPNPHWKPELRAYSGIDEPVSKYLEQQKDVRDMVQHVTGFLEYWIPRFIKENRTYITIAIGCTGGMHRSVYIADRLYQHFNSRHEHVFVNHRELS